jgi:hypothetical protein
MQISLLVPELLWPEPDDHATFADLSCPALETLLARGTPARRPPQSLEATLADAFGLPDEAPYAALRLLGESTAVETGTSCWLCCDPVHLRFHQDGLILADSGSFGIELDEARTLVEALNHHLSDAGRFYLASAERWYLRLADHLRVDRLEVPPLSAVAGRRIDGLLPATEHAKGLRKLLNEAQMLLHAHPINAAREAGGRLPVNNLWLWGAGTLPPRYASDFDGVWSTDPLALGLARGAGVPTHALPVDAPTLLAHAAADTHHLIVLEDLLAPVQYENGKAYAAALNGLEERWFAPLKAALAAGKIAQLRIEATTAYAALTWQGTRQDQWKLWRRPQALAALAGELAKASVSQAS